MPAQQQKSPLIPMALLLSAALAVVMAFVMFSPESADSPQTVSEPSSQGENALSEEESDDKVTRDPEIASATNGVTGQETPAVTATPAPTVTPEPTPSPEPTAEPTPEPTPEPTATPEPTQTPVETVAVEGAIRRYNGESAPGEKLYLVTKGEGRAKDLVARAFQNEETHRIITTDDRGRFRVSIPMENDYYLGLMVNDEPTAIMQLLEPSESDKELTADFYLPEPWIIRGVVQDEFGQALPEVPLTVELTPSTIRKATPEPITVSLETDRLGTYEFPSLEPAEISLNVKEELLEPPYLYEGSLIRILPDDFQGLRTLRLDIELVNGVTLSGVIKSQPDNQVPVPLPGATLELIEQVDPRKGEKPRRFKATSDENGAYSIDRLPPIAYTATITHPKHLTKSHDALNLAQQDTFDVTMKPLATVQGEISLADNLLTNGSVDVQVGLYSRYEGKKDEVAFSQSEGGAGFSFADIDQGPYWIVARGETDQSRLYGEQEVNVSENAEAPYSTLVLHSVVEIRGQLLGNLEETRPGVVSISAEPVKETDDDSMAFDAPDGVRLKPTVSVSTGGTFIVENVLTDTRYKIVARRKEDGQILGSAVAEAGSGQTVQVPTSGIGTVGGKITAPDGTACVGRTVRLVTGLGSLKEGTSVKQEWTYKTGYDGTYIFRNVPAGQARLILEDEQEIRRLISIPAGEVVSVNLECRFFVDVNFDIIGDLKPPLKPDEQFIIVAQPGYIVETNFRELAYSNLSTTLEPGKYLITRTQTMESREFEIQPRLDGTIEVDFSQNTE